MNREPLKELLAVCGREVARGGVFIDADHLYEGTSGPRLDQVLRTVTAQRLERVRPAEAEDWDTWWRAIEADPEFAEVVRERDGGFEHSITNKPSVHDYLRFLRDGGFDESGIVWQIGDDRIILGLSAADA